MTSSPEQRGRLPSNLNESPVASMSANSTGSTVESRSKFFQLNINFVNPVDTAIRALVVQNVF